VKQEYLPRKQKYAKRICGKRNSYAKTDPGDRTERTLAAAEEESKKNAARRAVRTVEETAVGGGGDGLWTTEREPGIQAVSVTGNGESLHGMGAAALGYNLKQLYRINNQKPA
jgi:hypothetical protein